MSEYPQINNKKAQVDAIIHTNKGDIGLILFDDIAPLAVKNFKELANEGYYNGVIFHRVIKNFMIQGGDPTGTGMGGESIYGGSFNDEFSMNAFNLYGALSMANAGPNTNGSQFFIVTAPNVPSDMLEQLERAGYPEEIQQAYSEKGGTPWLDHRHTVFGHVVDGMETVLKIEDVETGMNDKPVEDVVIESIEIL